MNIIFFTLGVSLLLSLSFLLFFIWSTKKGQYDDLVTPSHRAILDNEKQKRKLKTEDRTNE
ncbi:MAG TPA: cbb3-type cytochrome oxidase assembly protein CcoS [Thermodesulfobacteriota bacterium]|nr:cbb3-type cytochrome oxidase assembly protein CcoS [Thermodesulfobacteriota bacterium]